MATTTSYAPNLSFNSACSEQFVRPERPFTMTRILSAWIAGCFALWLLYRRLSLYFQRQKFQQIHQCRPAHALPQYETILGIDLMLENFKAWKTGRLLDRMQSRFRRAGNTYSATLAGQSMIFTIEPENIKAIFAEQFNDFDAGWSMPLAFPAKCVCG